MSLAWQLLSATAAFADDPSHLTASAGGRTVTATRGSYCQSERQSDGTIQMICADSRYPLPKTETLPAQPGEMITIETGVAVSEIDVQTRDAQSRPLTNLSAAPLDSTGRRFDVHLPNDPAAPTLGVFIRWNNDASSGDGDFEVGMAAARTTGRPRVVALSDGARVRACEYRRPPAPAPACGQRVLPVTPGRPVSIRVDGRIRMLTLAIVTDGRTVPIRLGRRDPRRSSWGFRYPHGRIAGRADALLATLTDGAGNRIRYRISVKVKVVADR
ncbi:MAG: hypothetical protein ACJ76Z_07270 [Thermoleophilaceae bacterium]